MAKDKNKVNVKSMSLEQLEAAAERASGTQKNKIFNEIAKRKKSQRLITVLRLMRSYKQLCFDNTKNLGSLLNVVKGDTKDSLHITLSKQEIQTRKKEIYEAFGYTE